MPVFEYQCKKCSKVFEILHLTLTKEESITCPFCQSTEYKRLISASNIGREQNNQTFAGQPACEHARSGACTKDCEFQAHD
jgi:putative FmdB family regulatory protein